jgi:hypothetical protein
LKVEENIFVFKTHKVSLGVVTQVVGFTTTARAS